MKKWFWVALISGILIACNNEGSGDRRVDSLANRVDSVANSTWDSGRSDLQQLKDSIENQFGNQDSLNN
jgi:hypothetical protein